MPNGANLKNGQVVCSPGGVFTSKAVLCSPCYVHFCYVVPAGLCKTHESHEHIAFRSATQGKALSQEERGRTVAEVQQYCFSQFPGRAQLQKWFQVVGQRLVRVTWRCLVILRFLCVKRRNRVNQSMWICDDLQGYLDQNADG